MSSDFLQQIGVMALTFGLFLVPALFSRRMERGDAITLIVIPIVAFPVAILPGILIWGFDKNSATYVLGALVVVVGAIVNYRLQPKERAASDARDAGSKTAATVGVVAKEA